ncbi:MAG: hypothetical protein L0Y72_24825 [Gemmataceae bacterium]|nr:hypothetical protein [Gemmataceae bacterium]MCI0742270.1 hypothetical protein [Gemmataceae bacterium]
MSATILQEIETRIGQLSPVEKQLLFDRLRQDIRAAKRANLAACLSSMAADPDIQREIREIEEEFADAATDGLENL